MDFEHFKPNLNIISGYPFRSNSLSKNNQSNNNNELIVKTNNYPQKRSNDCWLLPNLDNQSTEGNFCKYYSK